MDYLIPILLSLLNLSLILNYLALSKKTTSIQKVNNMGIGINLGNVFDSYNNIKNITTPDEQISLWNNEIPTKKMILNIKKNGFKTIRVPITWLNFIDETGKINSEWMKRIKEVVTWIINYNINCIINIQNDGKPGNWLSKGLDSKNKFDSLWSQIANEFRDYNENLIFESMDQVDYKLGDEYDYETLINLTQSFIDIIRNSGGKNKDRLLLIPGANADYGLTVSEKFQIPYDPSNNFAVSIHYYIPYKFTKEPMNSNRTSISKWGTDLDFDEIMTNYYIMKVTFLDFGIPIILSEVGVITEDKKDPDSIRLYLYVVFALAREFDGMMACLWDTSNKETGDMNFYNREKNEWYDLKIKNFLNKISKGEFISMWDYFIYTKTEKFESTIDRNFKIDISDLTLLKIIVSIKFNGTFSENDLNFFSYNKRGELFPINYNKKNLKRNYEGISIITIDLKDVQCFDYVIVNISENKDKIYTNYLIFEFEEYINFFDSISYSGDILKTINILSKN